LINIKCAADSEKRKKGELRGGEFPSIMIGKTRRASTNRGSAVGKPEYPSDNGGRGEGEAATNRKENESGDEIHWQ